MNWDRFGTAFLAAMTKAITENEERKRRLQDEMSLLKYRHELNQPLTQAQIESLGASRAAAEAQRREHEYRLEELKNTAGLRTQELEQRLRAARLRGDQAAWELQQEQDLADLRRRAEEAKAAAEEARQAGEKWKSEFWATIDPKKYGEFYWRSQTEEVKRQKAADLMEKIKFLRTEYESTSDKERRKEIDDEIKDLTRDLYLLSRGEDVVPVPGGEKSPSPEEVGEAATEQPTGFLPKLQGFIRRRLGMEAFAANPYIIEQRMAEYLNPKFQATSGRGVGKGPSPKAGALPGYPEEPGTDFGIASSWWGLPISGSEGKGIFGLPSWATPFSQREEIGFLPLFGGSTRKRKKKNSTKRSAWRTLSPGEVFQPDITMNQIPWYR